MSVCLRFKGSYRLPVDVSLCPVSFQRSDAVYSQDHELSEQTVKEELLVVRACDQFLRVCAENF